MFENKEKQTGESKKTLWKKLSSMGSVSKKDVLYFTKNLSVLLRAGSPLIEAINVSATQAKGRFKQVLEEVVFKVNSGQKFSVVLRAYPRVFSQMYTNMLEMGEESGTLDSNLEHLAGQLEKNYELKKKIVGAMFYPAIVFVGGVLLSIGITIFILPNVSKLFKNFRVELPFTTRVLLAISDFLQQYGVYTAIVGCIVAFGGLWLLRRKFMQPFTHWFILHVPVVRAISRHLNLTLMYRTMGVLLNSGVTIDESVNLTRRNLPNYYYRKFLDGALEAIRGGDSLTAMLQKHAALFPATDIQVINVGEHSGTLSKSLEYTSVLHEKELDGLTKNLSSIIEPILLITIGSMIGFLALSIITPLYSITGQFQN